MISTIVLYLNLILSKKDKVTPKLLHILSAWKQMFFFRWSYHYFNLIMLASGNGFATVLDFFSLIYSFFRLAICITKSLESFDSLISN